MPVGGWAARDPTSALWLAVVSQPRPLTAPPVLCVLRREARGTTSWWMVLE